MDAKTPLLKVLFTREGIFQHKRPLNSHSSCVCLNVFYNVWTRSNDNENQHWRPL